jgi:hypothetical protein
MLPNPMLYSQCLTVHLLGAYAARARWYRLMQWAVIKTIAKTITDAKADYLLERFAQSARRHWVLDAQFGEGNNRAGKDHSPENLALIRRAALNLLNNDGPGKDCLRRREPRACLSYHYRAELIFRKMPT